MKNFYQSLFFLVLFSFAVGLHSQCSFTGLNPTYQICNTPANLVGSPAGGVFSGNGVSGNTFNPQTAGIGTFQVRYTMPTTYAVQVGNVSSVPSGVVTPVVLTDDAVTGPINIGFGFKFYENTYTQFIISSNGFISFDLGAPNGCCTGQTIPNGGAPNNIIAGYWEDLNPSLGGQISYEVQGTAPFRRLLVHYFNIPHHPGGNPVNFQIILYETTNVIAIESASCPSDGGIHTQGLENASGTSGITVGGRNAANFGLSNDQVLFQPVNCVSTQTVTVTGVSCPANISVNNTINQCSASVGYTAPANCSGGGSTQVSGLASGANFPVGTTTNNFNITYASVPTTVTAPNGAGGTFTYNITDNDQTVALKACESVYGAGNCVVGACGSFTYYYRNGHPTCNCSKVPGQMEFVYSNTGYTNVGQDYGGVTQILAQPGASTTLFARVKAANSCSVANTWQVADDNLRATYSSVGTNTSSCGFTVTVNDAQAPSISCPANISQPNTSGICGRAVTYTAPNGTDNCSGAVTTQIAGLGSGATFPVGVTTNTFRVTDASGNSSTCSFTITITDTQLPTITCPANISQSNAPGICGAGVTYTAPNGTDNCPGASTTQIAGLGSGATFPVGITTNTFRVTDASGNTSTCSFSVNIIDTQLPTITCPANISQSNTSGLCGASVSYPTPSGTDNCPGASTTQIAGLGSGATFPVGITTNTFRVTDASGNTSTCSHTVTINDSEAPSITCPSNMSVSNDAGNCSAVATYTAPSGTDNCSGSSTSQTSGLASGSVFPVGVTTNTFLVTDASGNSSTCSFTITVNDTEAPSILCPSNMSVSNDAGNCSAVISYAAPVGTDNCSGASTTQIAGLGSGATFPVGATTNTFVVTDASGNSSTCSFTVTVNDTEAPTITCPSNISVSNDAGNCSTIISYTAPVGTDNCSGSITSQTSGLVNGSAFPVGLTSNTFVVTDASSNSSTCSFTVTVTDNENPVASCPANLTVGNDLNQCTAVVTYTAGATDNCGAILSSTHPSGSPFPLGTTMITITATDAAANTNTCTFTITVNDVQGPVFTSVTPVVVNVSCTPATVSGLPTPTLFDHCSGVASLTNNYPSTSYPLGVTNVIWTATDGVGNSSTVIQTVTVTSPEAHITGNGWGINTGTTTVSLTNHTDFGNVLVCSTYIDRTYLFRNLGTGNITLPGSPNTVALSGANTADFSIITQPSSGTVIAPGVSVPITIRFDPSATGYRNARVTVLNTDCNEAIYWFAIRGRGIACSSMLVPDPSGQEQTSGNDNTDESGETMGVEELDEITATIYPNPSDGRFTLSLSEMPGSKVQIKLLNDLGQVIYSNEMMSQSMYYDFSYLRAGTYYIQVISDDLMWTKPIIITQNY